MRFALTLLVTTCWLATTTLAQEANRQGRPSSNDVSDQPTDALIKRFEKAAIKRWSKDIAAFDKLNANQKDNPDAVLFIGSSSIRRWDTMATDMTPYQTIRRGYGGAKYSDMAVFAKQIVQPHQYRAIVMFVGNGIVGSDDDLSIDEVECLTRHIIEQSQQHQSSAPFFIIEITPCKKRFDVWPTIRQANARLRKVALTTPGTYFIPTAGNFLDTNTQPRSELFVDDQLHLNPDGYKLWSRLIKRRLADVLGTPDEA
ncbi:MAG: hypothetical protein CBB71_05150 [Rhodopirellula sp. TMED11]|nr:MAG: hypothetical protein CBB71_05150 [Rhodopirellula sp. TMED11]